MLKEKNEPQDSDQHCRNKEDLKTDNGIEIDAGSLWRIETDFVVLVDDDQHVRVQYKSDLFTTI
jgi:hypothetical protein